MKQLIAATAMICTLGGATSFAEDATCTGFSWPMEREAKLFSDSAESVTSGSTLPSVPISALRLSLVPQASAAYPLAPDRAPKTTDAKGGWFVLPAPAAPGTYQVTLGTKGWIDAVQSGKKLANAGFSSDGTCKTMHKSVRFEVAAEPITIQVSDVVESDVTLTILPVEQVQDAPPVTASP
jgi:hypothetical protein